MARLLYRGIRVKKMTESCQGCANVYREVTGVIECSFAPDGFVDRWRLVCRRDPPQVGLFGSRYPKVRETDWCSGFQARPPITIDT